MHQSDIEYKQKEMFVENYLKPTLQECYSDIVECEYGNGDKFDKPPYYHSEYIKISRKFHYGDGIYGLKERTDDYVNVTGNNFAAILYDVINFAIRQY